MTVRLLLRLGLALFLCAIVALGSYLVALQVSGNFHTVIPDQVYRTNQPSAERLARYARDKHIRAVLNLRGAAPGAQWYETERAAAQSLGLRLIDFSMSDHAVLPPDQIEALAEVMKNAPKPLLIHCKAGADRTGLAAALYLLKIAKLPPEVAEQQISIAYGHFSVKTLSRAWPIDISWEQAEHRTD